jgi:pimeloyl-ACP methyl ester carboxylesterase
VALAVNQWPGSRLPFLLVHGLASNARMWDGVAERLAGAGHRVVAVDLRGHGRSDKPDDGYDFETITADLVALLDGLAIDTAIAAGQSWGAHVVLELGLSHPDRVTAVACVDGAMHDMAERLPNWEQARVVLAPPELAGTPRQQIEEFARRTYADWPASGVEGMLANFELLDDGTVRPWLTRDRHMAIVRHLWEHKPTSLRDALAVPVVFISARDHDAHHDIHAQKPDLVAKVLLELAGA